MNSQNRISQNRKRTKLRVSPRGHLSLLRSKYNLSLLQWTVRSPLKALQEWGTTVSTVTWMLVSSAWCLLKRWGTISWSRNMLLTRVSRPREMISVSATPSISITNPSSGYKRGLWILENWKNLFPRSSTPSNNMTAMNSSCISSATSKMKRLPLKEADSMAVIRLSRSKRSRLITIPPILPSLTTSSVVSNSSSLITL